MPTKKNGIVISTEEVAVKSLAFIGNKAKIKSLEGDNKELRKPIEAFLNANGREDERGSKIAVITHAGQDITLRNTIKVSAVLNTDAEDVLRANHLDDCLEQVTVIREDVIERLHEEGRISDELLQKLYTEKSSFAFSVDAKPILRCDEA